MLPVNAEPVPELESIELEEEERKRAQTPSGYCAPYIGNICRKHVPRNSLVFYNLSDADDFANNVNEQIVASLWSELIGLLQEPCKSAAEKMLCFYAFPQCQWAKVSTANCVHSFQLDQLLSRVFPKANRYVARIALQCGNHSAIENGQCWRIIGNEVSTSNLAAISGCLNVNNFHRTITDRVRRKSAQPPS